SRAHAPARWLTRRFPRFEERAAAFREHAAGIRFGARGPTEMLFVARCLQMVQYGIAARAVGIDVGALRVIASEGVHLVAMAVGVLVPGGLGATEGAFTLAADLLDTTVARATAVALLMRCMQIVWVLLGSLVAFARSP
ncbi:MAG TPA: lysylphosphatidylglycerol synthase domain-containing protein, partial [Labilithrix sp.]|nr:lysylphosphatidylglycerol synthase domain-containing protein [Labilithrix sp.]